MAEAKQIKILDERLIEAEIIDESYVKDYSKVHKLLNSHIRKHGKILSDDTFKKGDEVLRDWLNILYRQGASQEKLTSYLRCGLAHLSYDYIDSTYEQIDKEDLLTRAMQSFKKRRFQKSFFKPPAEKKAESSKSAADKAGRKKIEAVKRPKSAAKKPTSAKTGTKTKPSAAKTAKKTAKAESTKKK